MILSSNCYAGASIKRITRREGCRAYPRNSSWNSRKLNLWTSCSRSPSIFSGSTTWNHTFFMLNELYSHNGGTRLIRPSVLEGDPNSLLKPNWSCLVHTFYVSQPCLKLKNWTACVWWTEPNCVQTVKLANSIFSSLFSKPWLQIVFSNWKELDYTACKA